MLVVKVSIFKVYKKGYLTLSKYQAFEQSGERKSALRVLRLDVFHSLHCLVDQTSRKCSRDSRLTARYRTCFGKVWTRNITFQITHTIPEETTHSSTGASLTIASRSRLSTLFLLNRRWCDRSLHRPASAEHPVPRRRDIGRSHLLSEHWDRFCQHRVRAYVSQFR